MESQKIAFIGAGNMTRALVVGLLNGGFNPKQITASNPSSEKLVQFKEQFGIHVTESNVEAAVNADIVVLAVKPGKIALVCEEIKSVIADKKILFISVATGVCVETIGRYLGGEPSIIRAMPNTPVAVSAGATALFANDQTNELHKEIAEALFRRVGLAVWLNEESLLDAVTAVSGSGPAYYFLFMEAMQAAAEKMGLDGAVARLLSAQTALGASKMVMETQHSIEALRRSVTSPKGTTEAAISVFNQNNMRELVERAMLAAQKRAIELAEEIE